MTSFPKLDSAGVRGARAEGLRQMRETSQPIYGTDLSKPVSEIVAKIRNDLTQARGQIHDVSFRWPGWGERLRAVEGLLTCGIVTLYNDIEEMKKAEAVAAEAINQQSTRSEK